RPGGRELYLRESGIRLLAHGANGQAQVIGRRIQFQFSAQPVKICKIHSPESACKRSLRSKMAASSEAKVTEPKQSATGKLFLIPPSPDTRRSSPILLTPGKS